MTPLPGLAWVTVIREIRREQRLTDYRLDSLVIQTAREIERERLTALTAHLRYEPHERLTGGE